MTTIEKIGYYESKRVDGNSVWTFEIMIKNTPISKNETPTDASLFLCYNGNDDVFYLSVHPHGQYHFDYIDGKQFKKYDLESLLLIFKKHIDLLRQELYIKNGAEFAFVNSYKILDY